MQLLLFLSGESWFKFLTSRYSGLHGTGVRTDVKARGGVHVGPFLPVYKTRNDCIFSVAAVWPRNDIINTNDNKS